MKRWNSKQVHYGLFVYYGHTGPFSDLVRLKYVGPLGIRITTRPLKIHIGWNRPFMPGVIRTVAYDLRQRIGDVKAWLWYQWANRRGEIICCHWCGREYHKNALLPDVRGGSLYWECRTCASRDSFGFAAVDEADYVDQGYGICPECGLALQMGGAASDGDGDLYDEVYCPSAWCNYRERANLRYIDDEGNSFTREEDYWLDGVFEGSDGDE